MEPEAESLTFFVNLVLSFGHFLSGVKQLEEGRRRCGYSHQRASWKIFGLLSYPQTRAALDSVLPTECAEDEVHDEEGAEEDEGAKVDPRPRRTAGVLHLTTRQKAQGRKKLKQTKKGTKKEKKDKKSPGLKKG